MKKVTVKIELSTICHDDQVDFITEALLEDLRNTAMRGVDITTEDSKEPAND